MLYQAKESRATNEDKKAKTVWAEMKLRSQGERPRPTRIPPGTTGRAFPRLVKEKRTYSDEERQCVAEMMDKLRRGEDLRLEKVVRAREGVAGECVDERMKLEVVADRLLDVLEVE